VKLDIKTVITLCTFVATLAGFYYSTQIRLDNLEEEVTQVEKQVKRLTRQLKQK
jgi:predicted ATP-grasp superfamily ATP-dependent carboligase